MLLEHGEMFSFPLISMQRGYDTIKRLCMYVQSNLSKTHIHADCGKESFYKSHFL